MCITAHIAPCQHQASNIELSTVWDTFYNFHVTGRGRVTLDPDGIIHNLL
jgi:hypothetical protein